MSRGALTQWGTRVCCVGLTLGHIGVGDVLRDEDTTGLCPCAAARRRGVCGDVLVCRCTLGFPFVLTPLFLPQWLAEGCSPAGRTLIISSAAMPLTPIPAGWL